MSMLVTAPKQTAAKNDDLLTLPECAEYLQLSLQYVYQLVHKKQLETVKVGNRHKVHRSVLDAYRNSVRAYHRVSTSEPDARTTYVIAAEIAAELNVQLANRVDLSIKASDIKHTDVHMLAATLQSMLGEENVARSEVMSLLDDAIIGRDAVSLAIVIGLLITFLVTKVLRNPNNTLLERFKNVLKS